MRIEIHHYIHHVEDRELQQINQHLTDLKNGQTEILKKMSEATQLLQEANGKLDLIDQRTTEEAAEIKSVVDELKEMVESGSVDVESLKALNARLDTAANNVANIYTADSGEVGQPEPVPEPEPAPEATEG